jgi:hypothetical protein
MNKKFFPWAIILILLFTAATCPPKPPAEKVWVKVCNEFPDLPPADARIANEYCIAAHEAQYLKSNQPTEICTKHMKPEPPIPQCSISWPETHKLLIWSGFLLCDLSTIDNPEFQESDLDDYYDALTLDGVNAIRSFAFFLDEQPGWESWKPVDAEYAERFTARLRLITERKLTAVISLWAYGGGSTDSEIDYIIDLARPFLPYVIFEPINEAYGMSGQIKILNILKAKGIPNSAVMLSFQDSGEFADCLQNTLAGEGLASGHGVGSMETIMAPWPRGWAASSGTLALMALGLTGSSDGEDGEHMAKGLFWPWLPQGPGQRSTAEQGHDITLWYLQNGGRGWEFLSASGFINGSNRPNLKDAIENGREERRAMRRAWDGK